MTEEKKNGLGIVETRYADLFEDGLVLDSGVRLGKVRVAYETYGALNADKSNVVVVCHALSGGAHAAGWHEGDRKPGWWDCMIGPDKSFDTNEYFIVSSSVLGGCYGTTGPWSTNPETGQPYGMHFPVVTVHDMVTVQAALLDYLGIEKILTVAGGSMGGMLALQWAVSYPERVASTVAIATTHQHSPQQIAFNEIARQSIMADPAWHKGDYYDKEEGPSVGLAIARMIGHVTYLSETGMQRKFGRRLRDRERYGYDFSLDFEVESYLRYQGHSFVDRFDANSLLYLTKALDYFELAEGFDSLTESFRRAKGLFLLIAFSSDWLYPPYQLKDVAKAIRRSGGDATYYEISSDYGHDAFLLDYAKQEPLVRSFLKRAEQTQAGSSKIL
ncbi:MAG: homoserine O-acetyltransferase MetX [Candidatus Sumerlaeota bacterium]